MATAPAKTANATDNSTTINIYTQELDVAHPDTDADGAKMSLYMFDGDDKGGERRVCCDQVQVDDQSHGRGHQAASNNGPHSGGKEVKDKAFGQGRGDQSRHETSRQGGQDNCNDETHGHRGKDDYSGPGLGRKDRTPFENSEIKPGDRNSSKKENIGDCGPNRGQRGQESRGKEFSRKVVAETDPVDNDQTETPVGDSQAVSNLLNGMNKVRFKAKIGCSMASAVVVEAGCAEEKNHMFLNLLCFPKPRFICDLYMAVTVIRSCFFNSLPKDKVYHGYPPLTFEDVTFEIDPANLDLYLKIDTLLINPPKTDDFEFKNLGRENDPNVQGEKCGEIYKSLIDREIMRKELEKLMMIASLLNMFKIDAHPLSKWAFEFRCPDKEFSLAVSLLDYVGKNGKEFTDDYERLIRGFLYGMRNDRFLTRDLNYNYYKDFDFETFFNVSGDQPSTPWSSTDEGSDADDSDETIEIQDIKAAKDKARVQGQGQGIKEQEVGEEEEYDTVEEFEGDDSGDDNLDAETKEELLNTIFEDNAREKLYDHTVFILRRFESMLPH